MSLTYFPKHLRSTRFNITQKSAQGNVLLWNPNEFTESHRCPLSRTIINKSYPPNSHSSETAFCIIQQLDVTKKNICLWYSCLVSILHFCPFPLFQSDTHSNCQLYNKRFRNYLLTTQMRISLMYVCNGCILCSGNYEQLLTRWLKPSL